MNATKQNYMLTQTDKHGQRLTLDIENPKGGMLRLDHYVQLLVKGQNLEAWRSDPEKFREWIAVNVANYIRNSEVKIYTHSK